MDKIVTDDWMNCFGRIEQKIVHKSERYSEVSMEASEPGLATAKSVLIQVPGINLSKVILRPENDLTLYDNTAGECIESAFLLSGQADSMFSVYNKPIMLMANMHAFQYSPSFTAKHTILSEALQALHISIDLKFFRDLLYSAPTGNVEELCNSFERKEAFQNLMHLQPRMIEIISLILNCQFKGLTRYLFIESKLLELLALQMEQINSQPYGKDAISRVDKGKLASMKNYIDNHFLEQLSLPKLCRMFTLNEFKVKKGFKQLFSTTVFGHIHTLRMNKAQELLSQNILNVTEIADFIGYENVGSFSAEFKKRFGYAPSERLKHPEPVTRSIALNCELS